MAARDRFRDDVAMTISVFLADDNPLEWPVVEDITNRTCPQEWGPHELIEAAVDALDMGPVEGSAAPPAVNRFPRRRK